MKTLIIYVETVTSKTYNVWPFRTSQKCMPHWQIDRQTLTANMKNLLLIGILFLSLISCEKDNVETMKLDGAWLENSHKTDTLVFDTQSSRIFTLYRSYELQNGYLLPKDLSGPYLYVISGDSIYLNFTGSSLGIGTNYYFNLDSKKRQIKIGNFFVDTLSNRDILIFSKMP